MEKNIQKILSELYQIDESLKDKEQELIKIINTMLNLKPNIKIDEDFKSELRAQISEKITSEKLKNYSKSGKPNLWQILSYVFGTAGIAAFGFFIFNENFVNNGIKNTEPESITSLKPTSSKMLTFENNITEVKNGFGSLKEIQAGPVRGMGGGGTESLSTSSDEPVAKKMIMPVDPNWVPEVYRYSFSGELNLELANSMPVYKKETNNNLAKTFASNFAKLNFNGVDLSNFSDLGVSNIALNQDKNYGYSLNIDFDNGYINIYKNWAKWPQVDYNENNKQVFLEESEIIKIALDFLKEYNIDLSKYAAPKIDKSYANILKSYTSSKIMPEFASNMTTVIFPLIIDGKEISEEYGQTSGVRIDIDFTEKKVTGFSGLNVENYLKSDYETEINVENILKVANVGGRHGFYVPEAEKVKYIDINLKNPKLQYVNTYKYDNFKQEQYLIPAVVFEIEKEGLENFYVETVVVPLVKDFYKYNSGGTIVGNSQE